MNHDWKAMIVYALTDDEARRFKTGPPGPPVPLMPGQKPDADDPRAFLRVEMIDQEMSNIGCFTCEQPWSESVASKSCPGEPTSYDDKGAPLYG